MCMPIIYSISYVASSVNSIFIGLLFVVVVFLGGGGGGGAMVLPTPNRKGP